ncbi:MAG: hypothetical protein FWD59_03050 [Micrococcales bacterium]|nr:hypothetical protein [Micrococcales bacterium]
MSTTRTTVAIDSGLLSTAKDLATLRHQTLGVLIEESLRAHLVAPTPSADDTPLPTFKSGGLRPGIDPSSSADLFAILDDEDMARWSL